MDTPIFADGEPAYFSNLPVKAMVEAIKQKGLPSSLSNSAGTFVCNHVMYGVLYHIHKEFPGMRGGFIHVPFITSHVVTKTNVASMALADITEALEAAVEALLKMKRYSCHRRRNPLMREPSAPKKIFVYGTLMKGFYNYERALAGQEVSRVPARIRGRVWHMTNRGYPL